MKYAIANKSSYRLGSVKTALGPYVVLIFLIITASILAPGFLTVQNVLNLLRSFSFLGFISIGMTFVILSAGIDLSVASVLALCGVVTALLQHWGIYLGYTDELSFIYPVPLIFFTVLVIGAALGFINGLVIAKLKIADFAATLGMMVFARGLAFAISGGRTIFGVSEATLFMGRGTIGNIPFVALLWIAAILMSGFVLKYTIFGKNLYASGENPEAARLSGINPDFYKIAVYTISGLLAALSGICMTGRLNVGEPRVAQGWELDAIAAVVIGGTSFAGGEGGIVKTVVGVMIIALIRNILSLLGILPEPQQMIMGVVLLGAVILQHWSAKREV
ncbi:MAG: ABC transporter permease [Candidatus Vecturithrix sp.]|jgi:ribose/xylose/arabinose/galactoside ABC-type transport system permease subunit|nr:ABC transporter permease [Candidatus Vecturithrix sp.]